MDADDISLRDLTSTLEDAIEIEDYPEFGKGPAVLALHYDRDSEPVHVVWGIPKGDTAPAVLITAYRPDPDRWAPDFRRRK